MEMGKWYNFMELEAATGGFCPKNVVEEEGYDTVCLVGGEVVAVKDFFITSECPVLHCPFSFVIVSFFSIAQDHGKSKLMRSLSD